MGEKKRNGFTLIELILVVAIMGVLSVGVMLTLNPFAQVQKASDARRKSDLSQIQKALETYYQDNGKYPANSSGYLIITVVQNPSCQTPPCNVAWGTNWQPYMNVLPKDPSINKNYVYYSPESDNGQSYFIYASLDRVQSSEACTNSPCNTTSCGGTCNFGVSSPDKTP